MPCWVGCVSVSAMLPLPSVTRLGRGQLPNKKKRRTCCSRSGASSGRGVDCDGDSSHRREGGTGGKSDDQSPVAAGEGREGEGTEKCSHTKHT